VIAGGIDAVTFTSAPAAASLLTVAEEDGKREELVRALRERVTVIAVGPVTAGPLDAAGIPSFQPERARLGALAREVVARLPERDPVLTIGEHTLQVRGYGVVLDGRLVELAPGPMAVLRALACTPGHVVPRAALIASLPGGGDGHAVEMAVARLRAALGAPVVETVVKRGYRLKV
jgi:uroporphyrinogen-III synthase